MERNKKQNILSVWISAVFMVLLNISSNIPMNKLIVVALITISVSSIVTGVFYSNILETRKALISSVLLSLECLVLGALGANQMICLFAAILMLFVSVKYFNVRLLVIQSVVYIMGAIILYKLNPNLLAPTQEAAILCMFIYVVLTGILYITTVRGKQMVQESVDNSKEATEQHELIVSRVSIAKEMTARTYETVEEVLEKMHIIMNDATVVGDYQKELEIDCSSIIRELNSIYQKVMKSMERIEESKNIINHVNTRYDLIGSVLINGKQQNQLLDNSIKEMEATTSKTLNFMHGLLDEATTIQQILNKLNEISSQTNLLALNASIEAARNGMSNHGFGIVANQIRELSRESKIASENMNSIVNDVISLIQEVSLNIDAGMKAIESSVNGMAVLDNQMVRIEECSNISTDEINKGLKALPLMQQKFSYMIEKLDTMIDVSSSNLDAVKVVSASIEEEERVIHGVSEKINNINTETNEIIQCFEL